MKKVKRSTVVALAALGMLGGVAAVGAAVPDPVPPTSQQQEVSAWRGPWPPSPCPWGAVWDAQHMSCVYR